MKRIIIFLLMIIVIQDLSAQADTHLTFENELKQKAITRFKKSYTDLGLQVTKITATAQSFPLDENKYEESKIKYNNTLIDNLNDSIKFYFSRVQMMSDLRDTTGLKWFKDIVEKKVIAILNKSDSIGKENVRRQEVINNRPNPAPMYYLILNIDFTFLNPKLHTTFSKFEEHLFIFNKNKVIVEMY